MDALAQQLRARLAERAHRRVRLRMLTGAMPPPRAAERGEIAWDAVRAYHRQQTIADLRRMVAGGDPANDYAAHHKLMVDRALDVLESLGFRRDAEAAIHIFADVEAPHLRETLLADRDGAFARRYGLLREPRDQTVGRLLTLFADLTPPRHYEDRDTKHDITTILDALESHGFRRDAESAINIFLDLEAPQLSERLLGDRDGSFARRYGLVRAPRAKAS